MTLLMSGIGGTLQMLGQPGCVPSCSQHTSGAAGGGCMVATLRAACMHESHLEQAGVSVLPPAPLPQQQGV